jgi:putative Holliday junction resolvase
MSDPQGIIAIGLPTIESRSEEGALGRILEVVENQDIGRIVVGMPLLMSGERGEAAESAQRFADRLAARARVPVDTYDERLTSALSERRLREIGMKTGHAKEKVDQGAAMALLESYLLRLEIERAAERAADDATEPGDNAGEP